MNIAAKLYMMFFEHSRQAFEEATKDPIKAQKKVLLEYLARNKDTEYGRQYSFASIRSIEEFRTKVPICDAESLRGLINRIAKGEQGILTKDRPIFFGVTSGTTSEPKLIPTTLYSETKKAETLNLWGYYIVRDHPEILKGKILALVSPEIEGYTESGIPFGAETGHGYKELPIFVRHLYALPHDVFAINDYDARYYTILRIAMAEDITTVATLNPNMIVLLCQKIENWQERIISDIEKGTLADDLDIPRDLRKRIEKRLRPLPERASRLRKLLNEKGRLLPKNFWPNIQLVECWKSGMMRLYLKELEVYFGDVPIRDMGCLSTEGRSSLPLSDKGSDGVLTIEANFYEFIPKEDIDKPDKRILLCDQVEAGKEYFMLLTTPGGLYRYNIDDIIRVTGFYNKTPTIEFVQKGHNALSLSGEKLYESQLNAAMHEALEHHGLLIEFFCAVGRTEGLPHYDLLIEFSSNAFAAYPADATKKQFLTSFEKALRHHDREYDYTRGAGLLGDPVLRVVKRGEFEKYRAKRIAQGAHEGQFKVSELTADQNFDKNFIIEQSMDLEGY